MNPWTTPAVVIRFVRIFPKVLTAGSAFEMWPTSSHPCPSMVGRTSGGIRRFAMVVEDFGDILFGNGKPMGPGIPARRHGTAYLQFFLRELSFTMSQMD